jgi:hypothetical protein
MGRCHGEEDLRLSIPVLLVRFHPRDRRRPGLQGRTGKAIFFALDARDGRKLWSFQTGAGHRGAAITYSVNARQYIATPTGWGSIIGRVMLDVFPEAPTFAADRP